MRAEGPALHELLHWLAKCPSAFLEEPRLGGVGVVDVAAVAADLLREILGNRHERLDSAPFRAHSTAQRNRQRLILVVCWLLGHAAFRNQPHLFAQARELLSNKLELHANIVPAEQFVMDEERREELVRYCLAALELRPAGESIAKAEDRLSTVNSVEQRRIMRATEAAARRAEQVRRELEEKARRAMEEAAAKMNRE